MISKEEETVKFWENSKYNFVDAVLTEIGHESDELCRIPSKDVLMNSNVENPLDWDILRYFKKEQTRATSLIMNKKQQ